MKAKHGFSIVVAELTKPGLRLISRVIMYPDDGADAESLLRAADEAMYEVRLAGEWLHSTARPKL